MAANETKQTGTKGWMRFVLGRRPKRTLTRAALLAVTSLILFKFILLPVRISGNSMAPAYHDRSINFVNRLSYAWSEPERGDVVAVKTSGTSIMFLKRIVGLPGETVAIVEGTVYINDKPLDEPYVKARESWEMPPTTLESDQYIVIGDNRGMDQLLHSFGTIRKHKIAGKVLW